MEDYSGMNMRIYMRRSRIDYIEMQIKDMQNDMMKEVQ